MNDIDKPITIEYLRKQFGIGEILPELSIISEFIDEFDSATRTDFACSFDVFANNVVEFKRYPADRCTEQEVATLDKFAIYIADKLGEEF